MVLATMIFSVLLTLLFIFMLSQPPGKVKAVLGILVAVSAVVALVFFFLMVTGSSGPDRGQAWPQLYVPCIAYLALAVWGVVAAVKCRKKK